MATETEVLNSIRQWIIQNGNNQITADVLRPILESILAQPNDKIGDLAALDTSNKEDIVSAINSFVQSYSNSNFAIHRGSGTPFDTPPSEYTIGDFYIHENAGIQGFYQFTGLTWVKITSKNNTKVTEIFTGVIPTAGQSTTLQEVADHLNDVGFLVEQNEIIVLSGAGKLNTSPIYVSYFFARNHISGEWGTGTTNGEVTADDVIINLQEANIELLKAESITLNVGDIAADSIWNYINTHAEPSAGEWNLLAGNIYFFEYTQNGQQKIALYEGQQPAQLGTGGNYTTVENDFAIVSDESSVTKNYVDTQDAAVFQNVLTELDYYVKKANITDSLTSSATNSPLSANQGRILKGFIDTINEVLNSDDTTLDELQEIVNYIKQNKSELQNLSIPNIAGLEDALAGKSNTGHSHDAAAIVTGILDVLRIPDLDAAKIISGTFASARIPNLPASKINETSTRLWLKPEERTKLENLKGQAKQGETVDVGNVFGNNYNYGAPSAALSYLTRNPVINGYAPCLINASSEPVVYETDDTTPAQKIAGADFVPNATMELVIESKDGVNIRYFFLEL